MGEPSARDRNPKRIWAGLAALVAALTGVVVWSLPGAGGDGVGEARTDGGAPTADTAAARDPGARAARALERLPEASCELALLSQESEDELRKIDADAIAKRLDARLCGDGCELVEKSLGMGSLELEVTTAEQYILPPKEAFETMGSTLTPAERSSLEARTKVLVLKTHGAPTPDQIPARTCLAAAAAAASAIGALVYDETLRRFETPAELARHGIVAAPGKPVFAPMHIAVQLYRHEDGNARLVTLGMARFGAPDLVVHGATLDDGPTVAQVLDAVAWRAAALDAPLPLTVTLADVARANGLAEGELSRDPAASRPLVLEAVEADRAEGDPDNDIVELVPPGGATPESWSAALAALYGEPPRVVRVADEAELEAAAKRARASLPRALARFEAGEGSLFVKGPFPIPGREDAGAGGLEWLWIRVSSCDGAICTGRVSGSPGYATNLAAGALASVKRPTVADWLLEQRDGGSAGGESIRILGRRR